MDQRRLELRIRYLKQQKAELEHLKTKAIEASQIVRLEREIFSKEERIEENKQWSREIDLDPGYVKLVRCSYGMHRPKLPVFESRERRIAAMENREGTPEGLSGDDVRRARETNARENAEKSIRNLDGRSPYIPEEERGPARGSV